MKISCLINYGDDLFVEELINNCLKTVKFCDEIIIIDFSQKGIDKKLINKYKLKVVKANNDSGFSYLRNLAADRANGVWLLYLDPDERITPILANEIQCIIKNPASKNVYSVARKNYYLGKRFTKAGAWPDRVVRLVKKNSLVKWEGVLHERPTVSGETAKLKEPLIHLTHRSIEQMTLKTLNWSKLEAKLRLDTNHPRMTAWRFWRIMLSSFWDNFVKKKACLDGTEGVIEGLFQMFSQFFTYVRLWEAQSNPNLYAKYKKIDQEIETLWQDKK